MINVIIPAYNCAATLGRTLASLVAQTDQNFEVIVVDDCSTEDITPIVEDYAQKLNLRYIRNATNMGCGMSRQVGIDNVSCSHFLFCDSDDILMPYAVETFNAYIEAKPETEYIHTYFYEQTVLNDAPTYLLHHDGFVWCHGKLYSAEAVRRFGFRNDPSIRWADDSYFNSMCTELLKMDIIPQPMAIWTNNPASVMRKEDPFRERTKVKDFLNAMILSCEFVKQWKDTIDHVPVTINNIKGYVMPNTEEAELLERLRAYGRELTSDKGDDE